MADEQRRTMGIGEGIQTGIGVLTALKQAVEETIRKTIDDATESGDVSADKARDIVREALRRAEDAVGEVRERLDVIPRREFDELRSAVADLASRVAALEGRPPADADHLLPQKGETTVGRGPEDGPGVARNA